MNKLEQVKAVYRTYYGTEIRDDCAEEICQLFEADEGRLLTDEETRQLWLENEHRLGFVNVTIEDFSEEDLPFERHKAKAQDSKTSAIKDRGCQERVEALIAEIEKLFRYLQVGDDIMDVAGHSNKGGSISYWLLPLREWQALKQREGVGESCTD